MKRDYETIVHPLKLLYDENSKILILGSFPSMKTGEYGFSHGHPQNRFWRLMEKLFDVNLNVSIEGRKELLLEHNVAVCDSTYKYGIISSSDSNIRNVASFNLGEVVNCINIKHVSYNGTASYKYHEKYHAKSLGVDCMKFPSTSPADAGYRLDDLVDEWKIALEHL